MGSPQDESHIQNSFTPTETIKLIRDGEKAVRGYGGGGRGKNIYLSLHCHHPNDLCINSELDKFVTRWLNCVLQATESQTRLIHCYSFKNQPAVYLSTHSNTCFGTDLYSVDTHHQNMLK